MRSRRRKLTALMTVFLFITVTLAGCVSGQRAGNADDKTALAAEFATYQEVPVNIQPAIKPYQVEPDLSNVTNRENSSSHRKPSATGQ